MVLMFTSAKTKLFTELYSLGDCHFQGHGEVPRRSGRARGDDGQPGGHRGAGCGAGAAVRLAAHAGRARRGAALYCSGRGRS